MRKEAKKRQRHQQMVTETGRHEATCTTKNRTSEGGRERGWTPLLDGERK